MIWQLKLRIILMLLILGGLWNGLYAQNKSNDTARQIRETPLSTKIYIDSLLMELSKTKIDTARAVLCIIISYQYMMTNPELSRRYAEEGVEVATKVKSVRWMGTGENLLGLNYFSYHIYDKSLEHYRRALRIFDSAGRKNGMEMVNMNIGNVYLNEGNFPLALEYLFAAYKIDEELGAKAKLSKVSGNIAVIYGYEANYPKALEYHLIALKAAKEAGDSEAAANATLNIGEVYNEQNDFKKALGCYSKALRMWETAGDKLGMALANLNIGSVYAQMHDYPRALEYFDTTLKLDLEIGEVKNAIIARKSIGEVYSEQGNYTEALEYLYEALNGVEAFGDVHLNAEVLAAIGQTYVALAKGKAQQFKVSGAPNELKQGSYRPDGKIPTGSAACVALAIKYLIRSLDTASKYDFIEIVNNCNESLYRAYMQNGDYKQALQFYQRYITTKDSIFSMKNTKKIMEQQMQYDQDKKDAVAKEKLSGQRNITYAAIAIFVLILVIAGVIFFNFYNRRKLSYQLKTAEAEMTALRAQMDPHFISNAIAGIQNLILSEDKTRAVQYLQEFAQLSRLTMEHARKERIKLQEEIAFLERYLHLESLRHENAFSFAIKVDPDIDKNFETVPSMLIQPFVENAIKHGLIPKKSNGHLKIEFSMQGTGNNETLVCTIDDNGIGRDQAMENRRPHHWSLATEVTLERMKLAKQLQSNKYTIKIIDKKDTAGEPTGTTVIITFNHTDINT